MGEKKKKSNPLYYLSLHIRHLKKFTNRYFFFYFNVLKIKKGFIICSPNHYDKGCKANFKGLSEIPLQALKSQIKFWAFSRSEDTFNQQRKVLNLL